MKNHSFSVSGLVLLGKLTENHGLYHSTTMVFTIQQPWFLPFNMCLFLLMFQPIQGFLEHIPTQLRPSTWRFV